jgi:hypothetical protein
MKLHLLALCSLLVMTLTVNGATPRRASKSPRKARTTAPAFKLTREQMTDAAAAGLHGPVNQVVSLLDGFGTWKDISHYDIYESDGQRSQEAEFRVGEEFTPGMTKYSVSPGSAVDWDEMWLVEMVSFNYDSFDYDTYRWADEIKEGDWKPNDSFIQIKYTPTSKVTIYEDGYAMEINFDAQGRPVSEYYYDNYKRKKGRSFVRSFKYADNTTILPSSMTRMEEQGTEGNVPVLKIVYHFSDYKVDQHGNWTSRKVTVKGREPYVEQRAISYHAAD